MKTPSCEATLEGVVLRGSQRVLFMDELRRGWCGLFMGPQRRVSWSERVVARPSSG
jgi:hypothetical protein